MPSPEEVTNMSAPVLPELCLRAYEPPKGPEVWGIAD